MHWHSDCPHLRSVGDEWVKKLSKRRADQQKEADLIHAILQNLEEHPQAQDTLEGIASFWVTRQRVRADVEAVAMALRKLTESGQLQEIRQGEYVQYRAA